MKLPHDAWVVVADGEKHLMLLNNGDADRLDLRVHGVEERDSAPNSATGTERPGRYPQQGGRRETVEQTDWRRLEKEAFAAELAEELNKAAARHAFPALVVIADPRTLGVLRPHLSKQVQALLAGEITADLAHATIPAIEAQVARA